MTEERATYEAGDSCRHHWLIPPQGSRGKGRCKKCGTTRVFSNATPYDAIKALDKSQNARAGDARKVTKAK